MRRWAWEIEIETLNRQTRHGVWIAQLLVWIAGLNIVLTLIALVTADGRATLLGIGVSVAIAVACSLNRRRGERLAREMAALLDELRQDWRYR